MQITSERFNYSKKGSIIGGTKMKLEYIENSFPIISIMVMMLAEMEETR